MPLWSTPESPIAARVAQQHASIVGTDPTHTASAPGTWPLMGEHIDHYGGIVAASLSDLRAAAAVSLRTDGIVAVHYIPTRGSLCTIPLASRRWLRSQRRNNPQRTQKGNRSSRLHLKVV